MKTQQTSCLALIAFALVGTAATPSGASPASSLLKALTKHAVREGSEEGAEKLTKEVAQETVERMATRLAREGGEGSLERVAALTAKHGPDVVRALDNTPSPTKVLKALEELPDELVTKAAQRLAAGEQGRELGRLTARHGATALRAEALHPGVGLKYVQTLGTDGASLCGKLSTDQAISLGRHLDGLTQTSPAQRSELIQIVSTQPDRFFGFLGRFVEKNPGYSLTAGVTLPLFLANSERILGGDEIVFDKDGNPIVLSKPGAVGRAGEVAVEAVLAPAVSGVGWVVRQVVGLVLFVGAIYAGIKLWGVWRKTQQSVSANAGSDGFNSPKATPGFPPET